jgi:hypothetical protein
MGSGIRAPRGARGARYNAAKRQVMILAGEIAEFLVERRVLFAGLAVWR